MSSEEDDLRARATRLLAKRQIPVEDESPAESIPARMPKSKRASAGELAKAAAAPGAGLLGIIAIVTQLLQARVSPEQLKALQDRVDAVELERAQRRVTEFERDQIENCRGNQADEYLQTLLPRADRQVGGLPKPWFDRCPDRPKPTTGAKSAPK